MSGFGLSPGQPRILHYLSEHDGCIQKDIASFFDLEPASVTGVLAVMEKNGLVRREGDEGDRRVLRVYLTERGAEAQLCAEAAFAAIERACFKGFSASEKEAVIRSLDRIYDNLKGMRD
jgi:DNA-binding MarR family transcriptional regulator